ncbi:zinc-binding protein [Candidatus Uhrbacteria bacterium]|nr:zinc-binding protein [Candidatus Uhrbacteria bacterium]
MTFDSNMGGGRPPRQMYDVSAMGLKCAGCGADITELPFQPTGDRPVYCRDCKRQNSGSGSGFSARPQRQMYDVSAMGLKCAGCGVDITELPFEPTGDRPVYCRECNRNRRQSYSGNRY